MSDPKQTALKAKITRLRNASKKPSLTLAEKLEAQARTKAAQEELRLYRLNLAAEKAYQKALPKLMKKVAKAIDNMAREITRERLRDACKRPPAEFQAWGHTRTMAWLKLAQTGNRLVKRQRPRVEEMQGVQRSLSTIATASLDACQQIISPPKKAK